MLLSKQALAQQMDQMADMAELSAAQIQANTAMNRMTAMMASSSRTMSVAQRNMNPERVSYYIVYFLSRLFIYQFFFLKKKLKKNRLCPHTDVISQTLATLEQFRQQNEEYAMSNGIYQDAITQSTSTQVSEDAVHELLGKLADDAGVELNAELNSSQAVTTEPQTSEPTAEEEDKLQQRLRALRA